MSRVRRTGKPIAGQYDVIQAGEWQTPCHRNYFMSCCHCGLVHRLDFRIRNGAIQFRAFRENRRTGQLRRQDAARKRRAKR